MHPTAPQRRELRRWFDCARWAYNAMAAALRGGTAPPTLSGVTTVGGTRGANVPAAYAGIHSTVWRGAMRLAIQAQRSNRAKAAARRSRGESARPFTLHPRRGGRAASPEVIPLEAAQLVSATKAAADYKTVLRIAAAAPHRAGRRRHADVTFGTSLRAHGPIRIVDSPRIVDRLVADGHLRHEAKLQWVHATDRFYLIVCWPLAPPPLRMLDHGVRVVALDPGLRRFQTWYDPDDGAHGELLARWGRGGTGAEAVDRRRDRVERLARRRRRPPWVRAPDGVSEDTATTVATRVPGRRARAQAARWRAADAAATTVDATERRRRTWLQNLWRQRVRERREAHRRAAWRTAEWRRHAHYDAIGFLLQRWDVVVASTARFGDMVATAGPRPRVFGRRTAARVYGWAHYAFNQRLASAAAARGVYVHWTTEDGTSKTCGACGAWNANLGGAATFTCVDPRCGVRLDRDVNGARNNLLCALTRCLRPLARSTA